MCEKFYLSELRDVLDLIEPVYNTKFSLQVPFIPTFTRVREKFLIFRFVDFLSFAGVSVRHNLAIELTERFHVRF